ncbi:MAG: hypothetical protein Q4A44_02275 [Bacteroidales bacterium]|nr:hypothetical protein [Bacteroidales bacterium]
MTKACWAYGCVAIVSIVSLSCTADHTYSNLHARAHLTNIIAIPPLYTAIHGSGEYCMVWRDVSNRYQYLAQAGHQFTVPPTALTAYDGWYTPTGSGFIIGRSNVPTIGQTELPLVAYDRACPTCYREHISKSLDFATYGRVRCPRCHRFYDLNNAGYVIDGEGEKLIRYRCRLVGHSFILGN